MKTRTIIRAKALWDGTGAAPVRDAAVVIEGERIMYAGPYEGLPPRSAGEASAADQVIDLPDTTLLPGFMDLHLHLADDGWTPLRLLANGITTVRDTGNNPRALGQLRARQQQGQWYGPRIHTFGPLIDGPKPHWPHIARGIAEGEHVEMVVDEIVALGVDGLKTYVHLTPDRVGRVVARAREHGLLVACHCGACMAREAVNLGARCIEHVWSLDVREEAQSWHDLDVGSSRVQEVIETFRAKEAWFCPTLAVMKAGELGWGTGFEEFPGYEQHPAQVRAWVSGLIDCSTWDDARFAAIREGFHRMQELVAAFHEAGVPMLAGSDSPFVPVGLGLHYEFELLAEAGLSSTTILRMATSDSARFLHVADELGTLQAGKLADVVAVRGNPLADVRATRKVVAVWQGGHMFDPAELHARADAAVAMLPSVLPEDMPPPFGVGQGSEKVNGHEGGRGTAG